MFHQRRPRPARLLAALRLAAVALAACLLAAACDLGGAVTQDAPISHDLTSAEGTADEAVLAAAAAAATAAGAADSSASGVSRTATGATGGGREVRIGPPGSGRPVTEPLDVGDCFNERLVGPADATVHQVSRADCVTAHDAQVLRVLNHPAASSDPFPGERDIDRFAFRECLAAFPKLVGSPFTTSTLRISVLRPAASSWAAGDRAIMCSVHDAQLAPLVGRVDGSKR